jgi:hypothetical protein
VPKSHVARRKEPLEAFVLVLPDRVSEGNAVELVLLDDLSHLHGRAAHHTVAATAAAATLLSAASTVPRAHCCWAHLPQHLPHKP